MSFWKKYGKGFLALLLVFAMTISLSGIPGVFADDPVNNEENTETTNEVYDTDPQAEMVVDESGETELATQDTIEENDNLENQETENIASASEDSAQGMNQAAGQTEEQFPETAEESSENEEAEVTVQDESTNIPYTMSVTFDGQKLSADGNNAMTNEWKSGESKSLQVILKKNTNVDVDTGKRYLFCMKVSDLFYFNGLPDVTKITGAEQVAIVKNPAPQVYTYKSGDTKVDLPGFSPYSGEIRILLNPSVDTITIPNLSVSFDQSLAGYVSTSTEDQNRRQLQVTNSPLQIRLVAVDNTEAELNAVQYTDSDVLATEKVDSVQLIRGDLVTGASKITSGVNLTSLDKFATSPEQSLSQKATTDGTIGYAVGTAGINAVYCKTLSVVFNQPYIEKNGEKYYLNFDTNDSAFQNKKNNGSVKGYHVEKVDYDENNHQFIYTFKDVYLELYQKLFYTPDFSWPQTLSDCKEITTGWKIQGYHWNVTEQTGYTDDIAGWWAMYPNNDNGVTTNATTTGGVFSPDKPDIQLVSSANPGG